MVKVKWCFSLREVTKTIIQDSQKCYPWVLALWVHKIGTETFWDTPCLQTKYHKKTPQNCLKIGYTTTNSSHLKIDRAPKGNNRIPTIHFQVRNCYFQGGYPQLQTVKPDTTQTHEQKYEHCWRPPIIHQKIDFFLVNQQNTWKWNSFQKVLARSLTVRRWKMMMGRWSFPFRIAFNQGLCLCETFKGVNPWNWTFHLQLSSFQDVFSRNKTSSAMLLLLNLHPFLVAGPHSQNWIYPS